MKFRLLLSAVILTSIMFGWGKTGHRIVGEIANQHLSNSAKQTIAKILGHSDLSRIGNWSDEIKSDPNWKHAWNWHFMTIPDGETFEPGKHEGVAYEKINDFISTLKDDHSSQSEKEIALKFLVHIVGDLHQPLHVGNGKDRGGNDVKVKWFSESTNLHRIWDTHLIDHQKLSYTEYANYLMLGFPENEKQKAMSANLMDFILESATFRNQTYIIEDGNLKWKYFYQNKDLLESRLRNGGLRLAAILNSIY
ncbi:MAG: S1/P1 nuclease [Candidatus Marinimicrobia bacterium]|nr:S1/P1 nuclease [Candidatus Neomarinimicrobiota bacterium]